MFTEKDLQQLAERGISKEKATAQMQCFKTGFPAILKFVPASGAASRMFKDLFEYL